MRQRGAHSRIRSDRAFGEPLASPLGGSARGLTRGSSHAHRQRLQAPGPRAHAEDRRVLHRGPRSTPENKASHRSSAPRPAQYAAIAGKSDALIKERTGCNWERWVKALDRAKAETWPHREIAKYVMEKYKIPGWWAQTVTVGYERIKGLRAVGQRRDGSFEANKSKTFTVPLDRLYQAFVDPRTRARWLPGIQLIVRTATRNKSMRITWPDGTSLEVGFTSKGAKKSQAALQHVRLPDRAAAARMKEYWAERLAALEQLLDWQPRLIEGEVGQWPTSLFEHLLLFDPLRFVVRHRCRTDPVAA